MRRSIFILSLGIGAISAAGMIMPLENSKVGKPDFSKASKIEKAHCIAPQRLKRFVSGNAPFKADFSIEGVDNSLVPVYSFYFDDGYQGWTVEPTANAVWSTEQIGAPGESKSFSNIDPSDVQSLFVIGDYRVSRREKTRAVSPQIKVPNNAVLTFYVGYSLNYEDTNRLKLIISDCGFPEEGDEEEVNNVIWCSSDATGDRPWKWRRFTIPLDEWIGKEVQFKFFYTYGSDDEIFRVGGYLGDYSIDNFVISGRQSVDHIDVMTGEEIHLVDITEGNITSWDWNMPGAVPSSSTDKNPIIYYTTDGNYDISLTVSDAEGNVDTKTISNFVSVTGTAPVAKIIPPATFRLTDNRLPLVAPLAPVTFHDGSTGFPTTRTWAITGVDSDASKLYTSKESDPEVGFAYLHNQKVTLVAQNQHGSSSDELDFTVEYSGTISNLRPGDGATTFNMEDWGVFPGSNTHKITAYAERFSKPSRPLMITGAYVFFNSNQAGDVVDQISSVGVHLCKSENGLPGEKIDDFWWSVYELDTQTSTGEIPGTPFPFTYTPFVDDEFFIMVDGIPEFKEADDQNGKTLVSFLMAPFRSEGNTALFLKDGVWTECSDYFPAGQNHTSFYIYPQVYHSVMAPLTNDSGEIAVEREAGEVEFQIFSYLGRDKNPQIDCDWLRVVSSPGEYTVDTLKIAYDQLPNGITERTGHITLTDGASTLTLTVTQNASSTVKEMSVSTWNVTHNGTKLELSGLEPGQYVSAYSIAGALMLDVLPGGDNFSIDTSNWPSGIYVIVNGKNSYKLVK